MPRVEDANGLRLDEAARLLAQAGIENARAEARLLLAHLLQVDRSETLGLVPTQDQAKAYGRLIERRAGREPFAYVLGRKEFWSMEFLVGPGVLIPRPETETLVEEALRLVGDPNQSLRLADLGTGSGAILIAALTELPNAIGTGFEASPAALAYGRANAGRLVGVRASMEQADWKDVQGQFDLIFSNPPYIASGAIDGLSPEIVGYEPRCALDGGEDGLNAYRSLFRVIPKLLKPDGYAFLEIGAGQAPFMEPLVHFERNDLEISRIAPDLAGVPRCLVLQKDKDCLGKAAFIG